MFDVVKRMLTFFECRHADVQWCPRTPAAAAQCHTRSNAVKAIQESLTT